jgi:hypothetical protein
MIQKAGILIHKCLLLDLYVVKFITHCFSSGVYSRIQKLFEVGMIIETELNVGISVEEMRHLNNIYGVTIRLD